MIQNEKDFEKIEDAKKNYADIKMSEEQFEGMKKRIAEAKQQKRIKNNKKVFRYMAAVAAAVTVFVALPNTSADVAYAMSSIPVIGKLVDVVTFRNYQYDSQRYQADVEVPELVTDSTEFLTDTKNGQVQENLKKTTDEINAEIQEITNQIVAEFESSLEEEEGYQNIIIKKEVLATTESYFTLKLICYQGSGSGAEWDYFYTIDLTTGERLALKDLFVEDADYITPISENIKEQMREQMQEDNMKHYWLTDEMEEWNFKAITEETSFYLNEQNEIVIAFNEGDIAPMYMGCVEFVIPSEVTADIRK